jgi:7-carboxy-7-deazaguanine synthase
MSTVEVIETFTSLQGESTFAGSPCFFIRLSGCNLRCRYCDTPEVYGTGQVVDVERIVEAYRHSALSLAEITGGEPLRQVGFRALAEALLAAQQGRLLVETNGSCDIREVPAAAIAIMDIKCPGSGVSDAMDWANLARLRPHDEVKFVLCDRTDYEWAQALVQEQALATRCHAVLFSPVLNRLQPEVLGAWILADRSPVRLQVQLHRLLRMK